MIPYVPKSRCRQGQWTLIGLLLTIAIIVILAAAYYPRIAAEHSQPGEALTPKEQAYGVECEAYVSQMNQAVTMYKSDHDDKPPTDLGQLKKYGVTDDMIDARGCSYQIDPATGFVSDTGRGRVAPEGFGGRHGRHHHGDGNSQDPDAAASGSQNPPAYSGYSQPSESSAPPAAPPIGFKPQASGPEDDTSVPAASPPVHITVPTGGL